MGRGLVMERRKCMSASRLGAGELYAGIVVLRTSRGMAQLQSGKYHSADSCRSSFCFPATQQRAMIAMAVNLCSPPMPHVPKGRLGLVCLSQSHSMTSCALSCLSGSWFSSHLYPFLTSQPTYHTDIYPDNNSIRIQIDFSAS